MRVLPITVTALTAALLLTACDSGGGSPDDADSSRGSTGGGSGAAAACRTDDAEFALGPVGAAPAAGDTGTVTVTVTGRGAGCTLEGFPHVALGAHGRLSDVPADKAAQSQRLTLAEGVTVSFTLTYVRSEEDAGLPVDSLRVGLPGSTDVQTLPWSYGDVAVSAGGSDLPNASVSAFQQAGD
jgi:hypothetical protein